MTGETTSHHKILEKPGEGGTCVVHGVQNTRPRRPVAPEFLPSHVTGYAARFVYFVTLVSIVSLLVAAAAGCGKKNAEKAESTAAEPTTLTIKGSDTMLPMLTALADAFQKTRQDTRVLVTDGGSTAGIHALLDGAVDLCMSSREINAEEREKSDFRRLALEGVVMALDGVAVIVHPQNPVNVLTMGQLRQIFNGKIRNWREVGGTNLAIHVILRDSDSGTFAFFRERVLQKDDYGPGAQLAASSAAVVRSVSQEPLSVGYVSFTYAKDAGVKVVGVEKNPGSPAVLPSPATVGDGSYPLERPLYIYVSIKVNSLAMAFLEFVRSPEGVRIVKEKGYAPV